MRVSFEDTEIETWFERNRAYVGLSVIGQDDAILEWWDEDVLEAVEDGFLDPRAFHASAYDYATHLGLIEEP